MGTSGSAYRRFEVTPNKAADVNAELDPVKTIKYKWPQSGVREIICGEPTGTFDPLLQIPWRYWAEERIGIIDNGQNMGRMVYKERITGGIGFDSFSPAGNAMQIRPTTFNGRSAMVLVNPPGDPFGRAFTIPSRMNDVNLSTIYGGRQERGHFLALLKMRDECVQYPISFGPIGFGYITYTFTPTGVTGYLTGFGGGYATMNANVDLSSFFNGEPHLLHFEWGAETEPGSTVAPLTIRIDGVKKVQIVTTKVNTASNTNSNTTTWLGSHQVGEKLALVAAGEHSQINSGPFNLQAAYTYIKERFLIPLTYEI